MPGSKSSSYSSNLSSDLDGIFEFDLGHDSTYGSDGSITEANIDKFLNASYAPSHRKPPHVIVQDRLPQHVKNTPARSIHANLYAGSHASNLPTTDAILQNPLKNNEPPIIRVMTRLERFLNLFTSPFTKSLEWFSSLLVTKKEEQISVTHTKRDSVIIREEKSKTSSMFSSTASSFTKNLENFPQNSTSPVLDRAVPSKPKPFFPEEEKSKPTSYTETKDGVKRTIGFSAEFQSISKPRTEESAPSNLTLKLTKSFNANSFYKVPLSSRSNSPKPCAQSKLTNTIQTNQNPEPPALQFPQPVW